MPDLQTVISETRQSLGLKPKGNVTPGELEERVHNAVAVAEMMQTKGWKVVAARMRAAVEEAQERVCVLGAKEFAGPEGLEAKGEVVGRREQGRVVVEVLSEGFEAQRRLQAMDEESLKREPTGPAVAKRL